MNPHVFIMRKALYSMCFALALIFPVVLIKSAYFWVGPVLSFTLLLRTLFLIYINESFTAYLRHIFVGLFSMLLGVIVAVLYFAAVINFKMSVTDSLSLAMVPVLLFTVEFSFIYFTRSGQGQLPYEIRDHKVLIMPRTVNTLPGNLLAVAALTVAGILIVWGEVNEPLVISCLLTVLTLYILYFGRDNVRIWKAVRAKEKKKSERYTFEHIDQLREARSRWWVSRLLNWLISLCKSSGS